MSGKVTFNLSMVHVLQMSCCNFTYVIALDVHLLEGQLKFISSHALQMSPVLLHILY
jgi:hypothetical protein